MVRNWGPPTSWKVNWSSNAPPPTALLKAPCAELGLTPRLAMVAASPVSGGASRATAATVASRNLRMVSTPIEVSHHTAFIVACCSRSRTRAPGCASRPDRRSGSWSCRSNRPVPAPAPWCRPRSAGVAWAPAAPPVRARFRPAPAPAATGAGVDLAVVQHFEIRYGAPWRMLMADTPRRGRRPDTPAITLLSWRNTRLLARLSQAGQTRGGR